MISRKLSSSIPKYGYSIPCNKTFKIDNENFTVYLKKEEFCNDVVNCPDGEDENFERCESVKQFPASVNFECISLLVGNSNVNVTTKATKCNGEVECKYKEDEQDCEFSKWTLAIVLGSLLVTYLLISKCALRLSKVQKIVEHVDLDNADNEKLEALVVTGQLSEQRQQACRVLFEQKMAEFNGNQSNVFNDLKVRKISVKVPKTIKAYNFQF